MGREGDYPCFPGSIVKEPINSLLWRSQIKINPLMKDDSCWHFSFQKMLRGGLWHFPMSLQRRYFYSIFQHNVSEFLHFFYNFLHHYRCRRHVTFRCLSTWQRETLSFGRSSSLLFRYLLTHTSSNAHSQWWYTVLTHFFLSTMPGDLDGLRWYMW